MRKLMRRGVAFLCAMLVFCATIATPVYAEEDANTVSFAKLASAAAGFLSDSVAHEVWVTESDSEGHSGYESVLTKVSGSPLKAGNAGGLLGYPDEANCGGVVWDWLASRSTTASVTYSYSSLIAINELDSSTEVSEDGTAAIGNPLSVYAYYGYLLNVIGLDHSGTDSGGFLGFLDGIIRSIGGGMLGLMYQLSNMMNALFGYLTQILQFLNPFTFFGDVFTATSSSIMGVDTSGSTTGGSDPIESSEDPTVEGLLDAGTPVNKLPSLLNMGYVGEVLTMLRTNWVWTLLIPLFFIILLWNLLVAKNKNKSLEIKKFLWRVFTMTLLIALIGGTYTQVLMILGRAYGTVSPATKVIMSTYFDFQSWVEDAHMHIPAGEGMTSTNNFYMSVDGEPRNQTVLSVRSTALQLNLYSLKKSMGDDADWAATAADTDSISVNQTTVDWNQSMRSNDFDVSAESSEWVSDLLSRYGSKAKYQASDWEAYYKNAYLDYSNSDDEDSAGRSLANIIQHTDDALDWKKIDDNELTPGKQLITNDGSASFETSGETYYYNNSPNLWNVATAYVGTRSVVVGDDGELDMTGAPTGYLGYLSKNGFYIYPSNNCLLSPMAIYNYLNTSFTSTGLVVYNPELSSNAYSREFHYSVNLVGDDSLGFLYGLNAMVLMGCLTVLSLFYFLAAIFASVRRTMHLVITMPLASMGSLRFAAKLIYHAIMLVAEIVVTMLLYSVVTDLLVSMMTILESVFAYAIGGIQNISDLEAATVGAEQAGTATQLLNVNSGTILFSGLNPVPMAGVDDNFVFGAKALEIITVLLSIVVYILLTKAMIKYRKVVVKGVDEMVGDWTTAFVPGARNQDMGMPDSKVAANFDRGKGALGAALGAGAAATMASRGLEADKADMEGDTESVDNNDTDVNAPTTVNATQAGEDAQGAGEDEGVGMAENQTMDDAAARSDMQDRALASQLNDADSLDGVRGVSAEMAGGAVTDAAGEPVATTANGQPPMGYDDVLAGAGGDAPDDIIVSDDDQTSVNQNISDVDSPDFDDEVKSAAKDITGAAAAGVIAADAAKNGKGDKHGLTPEDKKMLANQTEDAAENQIEAIRDGHAAAADALGRDLNRDEKDAATLGAVASMSDQDGMNKRAAEAGVKAVANGPMSQEQMDKLTAPVLKQLSEGALTQAAVQDAVEDGMRRELGRDLTPEEKEQAKQIAAGTIAKSKEAASDRALARTAALEGAKAMTANGELNADQTAAALKAADAAMDQAEASVMTANLAAAEAVRAATAANGGELTSDQQAAVEQQAQNTVDSMEKAAIASAEKANGGKLTESQLKAVKDSVANKAVAAATAEGVNLIRASKGQMPLDANTEKAVRARAAQNAVNAKAAVTGANAAGIGAKAGAESIAGGQMTAEQEEKVSAVSQEQVDAAEGTISGSTISGMAGAAAVAGVSQIAPGKTREELAEVRTRGEKRGNIVMQRNKPINQVKKAGYGAAVQTQRAGMARPGMTAGEAREQGERAALVETSGVLGAAVTVAARNQTVTQQQQVAAESGGSRVTRTGATSYQDADGTGTNMGGEQPAQHVQGKQGGKQTSAATSSGAESGRSMVKDSRFVRMSASQAAHTGTVMQQSADAVHRRAAEMKSKAQHTQIDPSGQGTVTVVDNAAQLKQSAQLEKAASRMENNAAYLKMSSSVTAGSRAAGSSAKTLLIAAEKTRKHAEQLQKMGCADEAATLRVQATQLEQRADTLKPGARQHRQNVAYMKKVALFTYMAGSDKTLVSALGQAANMGTHINFWQDMESQRAAARNGGYAPAGGFGGGGGMSGAAMASGMGMSAGKSKPSGGSSTTGRPDNYREQAEAANKARWNGTDSSGRVMDENTMKRHEQAVKETKRQAARATQGMRAAETRRQQLAKELEHEQMVRKTLERAQMDDGEKVTDGKDGKDGKDGQTIILGADKPTEHMSDPNWQPDAAKKPVAPRDNKTNQ